MKNKRWQLIGLIVIVMLNFVWGTAFAKSIELQSITSQMIENGKILLTFTFSQPLPETPRNFIMTDPNRIVWDFPNVTNALNTNKQSFDTVPLQNVVLVSDQSRLRVLLYLQESVQFSTRLEGNHLYVTLISGYQRYEQQPSPDQLEKYTINNLDFRIGDNKGAGQVVLDLSGTAVKTDVIEKANTIEVTLYSTTVPEKFAHRYDVTDYSTPVTLVEARQKGDDTVITITAQGKFSEAAYQVGQQFMIDITPLDDSNPTLDDTKHYTGELISLDFQNIQVRAILQLLAEFTGKNIIISNSVNGNITLSLKDVPWDQALDIILTTRGLAQRQMGNVIMVAPAAEINALETQELTDKNKLAELAPLYSETFHIKYGSAQTYYDMLRGNVANTTGNTADGKATGLLSDRGKVILDVRTNTLFVDDTAAQLKSIRDFLDQTDVPVMQVMIETRIVAVTREFERDLGVNFSALKGGDLANGGFNMDFGGDTSGPGYTNLNLQFSQLPSNFLLDLELSALESENDADIIASPRVITANNVRATIEQGTQIPYNTQAASGGTTVQFVTAVLKLDVTPQITPDNKIIMQLIVNQDIPTTSDGTTLIDTKRVETSVLVDNGETIVLGGIYERNLNNVVNRIPFLSDIPILGKLFTSTSLDDERRELLIFVTPRIVNPDVRT